MFQFIFKRHCIVSDIMKRNPNYKYFFFLDSDIGVINPNKLLEDYINPNSDIVLSEKTFNSKIMIESYIVRWVVSLYY